MRRYSITYFIGQSVNGLWRNGVMSTASIMVLMSCLVVMGSFALLVLNLNLNLDEIGVLNEIQGFVDTTIDADTSADTSTDTGTQNPPAADLTSLPDIDVTSSSALSILDIEKQVVLLDNFTDIAQAYKTVKDLEGRLPSVQTSIEAIADENERANEQLYFDEVTKAFNSIARRVNSVSALEMKIRTLDNVASTVFTSKATALTEQKAKYSDYPNLFKNLKNNTLPDKFTITYTDNSKVSTLEYVLNHLDPMLYKVNCYTDLARQIASIKHGVILIFTWFLAILFVVSVFVIINTIKLAVFARRQEIIIMRYVGATNWFITLPFVFEGIIIGLVASALAYIIQYYMYIYVQNILFGSLQMISLLMFDKVKIQIIAGFAGVGILTGIIGSGVSLRKYLNV